MAALCLWLAGGFQASLAPRLAIAQVAPDFVLIVLGSVSILSSRRAGTVSGFFGGLIEGGLAGANLTQYVISRSLAGFLTGWLTAWEFEATVIVAFFAVVACTLEAQLLLLFLAPPTRIFAFLLATIGSAIYNGVLAMPLFALLKRIVQ
jgi:rod shape-determining protein MreD